MANRNVPKATLHRYPIYLKALRKLANTGVDRILSKELSEYVNIESTTIRRDFSFLGNLGKQGYGYDVKKLIEIFSKELGLEFDEKIIDKEGEIQAAIDDKPTYKIPDMYRTVEQKDMSDEDYLSYLDSNNESIKPIEDQMVGRVRLPKQEKVVRRESPIKKVTQIIGSIVGWAISIFTLIFVLAALIQGGIVSAIIFIVSALSINPLIYKSLKSKLNFVRKWMVILLFVVTFIIGIVVFPTSTTAAMAQVLM